VFGYVQKEVVAALPKLIKLNPVVVKEVFNRLLGVHSKFCDQFCVDDRVILVNMPQPFSVGRVLLFLSWPVGG